MAILTRLALVGVLALCEAGCSTFPERLAALETRVVRRARFVEADAVLAWRDVCAVAPGAIAVFAAVVDQGAATRQVAREGAKVSDFLTQACAAPPRDAAALAAPLARAYRDLTLRRIPAAAAVIGVTTPRTAALPASGQAALAAR